MEGAPQIVPMGWPLELYVVVPRLSLALISILRVRFPVISGESTKLLALLQ
jgi:hypothetical protein